MTPPISARDRLAFALDYPDLAKALVAVEPLRGTVGVLKVGLELFAAEGPKAITTARELGFGVFADLKLHDIPETVDRAVAAVAALGARYVTLHAAGGPAMLERAARRAEREATGLVPLAVTVLTSLDDQDLVEVGVAGGVSTQVQRLAEVAWGAGIRGFVCSPHEASKLRSALGAGAFLVTPGVRPATTAPGKVDDQKRVATPTDAIRGGADLLVVGRPIRDADDPVRAAQSIVAEIAAAAESAAAKSAS